MPDHLLPAFFGLFLLIGLACLAGAGWMTWSGYRWLDGAIRIEGIVVAYRTFPPSESGDLTTYGLIVGARTPDGADLRVEGNGSSSDPAEIGSRIMVGYPAGQPDKARLLSFFDFWIGPLVLCFIGTIFGLLGIVGLRFMRHVNRDWICDAPGIEPLREL